MWFAVFYIWGIVLAFSVGDICPETSEDAASWIKLKPKGHCGDEEDLCPYRLTLPALSIQLPRPFRELEEMAKELQNLKKVVNQLRIDCQECKDRYSDEEERRHQSPRQNISIKNTQSSDEEKVAQIFSSALPQGDRSESGGPIKGSEKRSNHSILEVREWNINPRINLNQGTTDPTSEMNRDVKIFNPLLDVVREDISKVPTPVGTERELKRSGLAQPSLPVKKDDVQFATHVKQQANVLRDGHAGNISDILTVRTRVQYVPDPNVLRDPNIKTTDLSMSEGNRRVLNFPGGGRPLRPRGSYINSRVVKANNGDRLKNPAIVRKTNPQVGEMMDKIQPEEAGFSPARSGVMRVKETSPHIANTKSGTIRGSSPSTDDQNKHDFSGVSGPKTDDKHVSQVTIVREDNSRNINMTEITRLPTNLRKEKQGDASYTNTNKSFSSIMNQAEQPNIGKEEEKHIGLSEGLVIISSSAVNREDLPSPGRQVEIEKYLNPITESNNGQIDSTVLDKADRTLNARTVNPMSPDLTDKMLPEMFIVGAIEETGFNSLNAETVKKDILSHSKATFSEDLVKPTIVPTVKSKSINSNVRMTSRSRLPIGSHGAMRTSITPLKAVSEQPQNSKKNISMTHEMRQKVKYTMPSLLSNPDRTVMLATGPKLRPNVTGKMSANRSVGVHSKLPIPPRNVHIPRKNVSGILKPIYTRRKPNFQTEMNTNRGIKTKVSTATQFFSPTGATSTVEREEIKHIPRVITSNVLDNHRLKNNITEPILQPESQNAGDIRDLDKVQEAMNRAGDNSEIVLISNNENRSQDPNTMQSGTTNSPAGEKERQIFSLGGANINGQNPSEWDKISSGRKRPTASTLKKELPKEPDVSQFLTSTFSFTDTEHGDSTKNIPIVTNTHAEKSNLSLDTPRSYENTGLAPNVRSTVLHNRWLKNNNTESKSPPMSQTANVQDLDKVQQGKTQVRDNSEAVLIFNTKNSEEDLNMQQSGGSNSPTGGKERKTFSLGTAVKVDKKQKGPNAPTLKKKNFEELFKEPGTTQFTTSTVSFTDTSHRDSAKIIGSVTNAHDEMPKNISRDTPISFESIGATRELEHIKLNKDRVDEIPGDVLSNPNTVDTTKSYSGETYAIPVVLETLTNTEEIKGTKLFSLSPEDTAEGFKSHAVSDEVTEREKAENKIHSTCLGNCNNTSTPHSQPSTSQTRTPLAPGREKGPAQDCTDYITKSRRNGVYRVTPRPKNTTFPVFCDMASSGGGWTLIQHRFDGSTSFNRTWDEYKNGFGKLIGEFWLGNDKIHLLTKAKNMSLLIEIEDFDGIREYAQYDHFYVANESQQYRLSIDGYSGTAGNAMQFSKKYNHDQKFFTTPDRDNDQYPSGNCGAYYSSGWWFDACMSANLNGKYYQSKYKGVRNGIFWGTWHNITMEYYPTNERQSFRTVRMMIRPKNYAN